MRKSQQSYAPVSKRWDYKPKVPKKARQLIPHPLQGFTFQVSLLDWTWSLRYNKQALYHEATVSASNNPGPILILYVYLGSFTK